MTAINSIRTEFAFPIGAVVAWRNMICEVVSLNAMQTKWALKKSYNLQTIESSNVRPRLLKNIDGDELQLQKAWES